MRTKTIGELLVAERVKRNLSVEDLAASSKVSAKYLHALEANQFHLLPAASFVKGFIKHLASIYTLDPQPLIATLRRDFKESATGQLVPRDFIRPVLKKNSLWTPLSTTLVFLATIFLTLISYVVFQWYSFQKPPVLEVSAPQENQEVGPTFKVQGKTVSDAIVSVNTQPVSLYPDGRFEAEILLPRAGMQLVTIEAVDRRGKKSVIQRIIRVQLQP